ncbi:hematopoietic progenitor cell antigen CD34 [Micropterus salmoides]|uniref:hematopoietic progenitor cell antigen CD34 n=1 Tax=Micropterus salmoides TaxID=27706 RepID=UPI0018ECD182|nr:hematopoietic progenitor cell antigen CD34 [Micropterus salmoides]
MAASFAQRTNGPCKMLAFAFLLIISLINAGVTAQGENATATRLTSHSDTRGDMIPLGDPVSKDEQGQALVFPTMQTTTSKPAEEAGNNEESSPAAPEKPDQGGTDSTVTLEQVTPAPIPARGDGPKNIPQPVPRDDVNCVSKEAVKDRNAVSLKLKASSNCKDTKMKIESVLQELCGEDCKLEIFQEDNSDEILVSGKYVEGDVVGMANKFNNDNIKDKTNVKEAIPRWGKNSKLVLVSLLLTGLLLAALLVAGYYLKTHRKNSKGVRLAESFQVDEENQANTLVSVAPLPQEPLDKQTGESPPENGTNPAPTTNGHSATQNQVGDTEM